MSAHVVGPEGRGLYAAILMTDYAAADFFRAEDLLRNPYPYFDFLDVSAVIDRHRYELPFSDMILSLDPPEHTARRGLTMLVIAGLVGVPDEDRDKFAERFSLSDLTLEFDPAS